jgi:putative endonuclease
MSRGDDSEDRALRFLESRGLQLVVRNWRCRLGELDLVLRDGDTVVVAEVRGRSRPEFGSAAETVDRRKQQRIARATQQMLARNRELANRPLRFDIVAIDGGGIEWLQGAFEVSE